jgi:hypothetical protein
MIVAQGCGGCELPLHALGHVRRPRGGRLKIPRERAGIVDAELLALIIVIGASIGIFLTLLDDRI